MNIFNRKTSKKQIELFAVKIAELLEPELPQLRQAITLKKVYGIQFTHFPTGIYITYGHDPKDARTINLNHNSLYFITGISVFNTRAECFQPITLFYQADSLTRIEVEDPEYFHKTFDLTNIQKNVIEIKHLKLENGNKKIVEKILQSLSKEQLELLELDSTFEIEDEAKRFFTILDMEDGNYIAVDKSGKIFRLNHDHKERIRLIAKTPSDFFNIYSGLKSDLEKIMEE